MICLECDATLIDFWLNNQMIIKSYESKNETGRDTVRIFNPQNLIDYKITCSTCGEILKERDQQKIRREKSYETQSTQG